jgi:hypothetical protein
MLKRNALPKMKNISNLIALKDPLFSNYILLYELFLFDLNTNIHGWLFRRFLGKFI